MAFYHGDIDLGDTIDIKFHTGAGSGIPGAANFGAGTALAGTPVVSAYPGNSLTQLTAGITLTTSFDGLTGLNNVRVEATSANGYVEGTDYALVITTGTIGGVSAVGMIAGSFSIRKRTAGIVNAILDELTSEGRVAGSYGQLLKDNLNATVSSRSTQVAVDDVDADVALVKAKTDLIPGTQDGRTFAELTLLMAAVLLGKSSGLDTTTAIYRAVNDSKNRVTAAVDVDGNRSAVTLDST